MRYACATRGCGSVVEHHLAKVRVASSNLVIRSKVKAWSVPILGSLIGPFLLAHSTGRLNLYQTALTVLLPKRPQSRVPHVAIGLVPGLFVNVFGTVGGARKALELLMVAEV